jgi:hypothetical protein
MRAVVGGPDQPQASSPCWARPERQMLSQLTTFPVCKLNLGRFGTSLAPNFLKEGWKDEKKKHVVVCADNSARGCTLPLVFFPEYSCKSSSSFGYSYHIADSTEMGSANRNSGVSGTWWTS